MGHKSKKRRREETPTTSISNVSAVDDSEDSSSADDRRGRRRRERHRSSSRRDKEKKRERRRRREREERERERERRNRRKSSSSTKKGKEKDRKKSSGSGSGSGSESGSDLGSQETADLVRELVSEFPNVGPDLMQLLQMIDNGQAVDIKGISERALTKHLEKLFISLNLEESGDRVFLLPTKAHPTLEIVGPLIQAQAEAKEPEHDCAIPSMDTDSVRENPNTTELFDESNTALRLPTKHVSASRRRVIGPEMPSAELLAAASKLTEAQAELSDAELEGGTESFIGPAPPAMVAESESANEAERFEEITRIMEVEGDSPYDIIGANHNMSADNIKKRYWKLSLLVHPDKCSHPQAHQAFIKLNKAFKEIQDPDKRKLLDEKIKLKEEQEQFKVELRAMREAAQWRKSQGISMEGDDELLAETEVEVKVAPKREEWMTELPPERKPGMTMQSTKFSRGSKEGRGDTSIWTDTPSDRAHKAKMSYLEAYNEATMLASKEEDSKRRGADAALVDDYNKTKRSKSLVQKHQEEEAANRKRKKTKEKEDKEEWVGQHPWKPWDREKDLVAGRKNVKLEADKMTEGLTSRFSSGNFQRNFL